MQEAQSFSIHVISTTPLNDRPDFLASLDQQAERSFQIIHIDQSQERGGSLTPAHPALEVIHLRTFRHVGMARAHNQAIALALSRWPREQWPERWIALCRPEVAFDTQCLTQMKQAFERYPDLMVLGPKILQGRSESMGEGEWLEMNMTNQIYSLGCDLRKDRVLVFVAEGREDEGDSLGDGQREEDELRSSFLLPEACMVFRASALAELQEGGQQWLDERMPSGQELLDLVWRAQRVGMRVAVATRARVWFAPMDRPVGSLGRWRERYLTGPIRAKHDHWMMQILHFPWFFPSLLRSLADLLTHPRYWYERQKTWRAWRRSSLKQRLSSAKPCSIAVMRQWFV